MIMSLTHTILVLLHIIIISVTPLVATTNGLSIRMIPIDSPRLNILPKSANIRERLQLFNNVSMSRVNNLQKKISVNDVQVEITQQLSSVFVTQLNFSQGETIYTPYVALDTGTEITWVQCAGCDPSFELNYSNFAYNESTSFTKVTTTDDYCLPPFFELNDACGVSLNYTGAYDYDSDISGILGREDFRFMNAMSESMDPVTYPGLVFGCVLHNRLFGFGRNYNDPENKIAGVFGLASGQRSIITQLETETKGRFYYCLPKFEQPPRETSLVFGDYAQISGDASRPVQTISMHVGKMYHLYLSGISVDDKRLQIGLSNFTLNEDETQGFFIDTGAPYTLLHISAYTPLRKAIVDSFRKTYGWEPVHAGGGAMDLCYSHYPDNNLRQKFPTVTFYFSNIQQIGEFGMVLDGENLFLKAGEVVGEQGFCLMMASMNETRASFLGAYQQVNFAFLYDIGNRLLSFVRRTC